MDSELQVDRYEELDVLVKRWRNHACMIASNSQPNSEMREIAVKVLSMAQELEGVIAK